MPFAPEPGPAGSRLVTLAASDGATAQVHLHGAHVTSWRPAGETGDRLYLSPRSRYGEGEAIRGGVPVCFPQFSRQGPLPNHGFARTTAWTLVDADRDAAGAAHALLRLEDSEATRALWPHRFVAEFGVTLAGREIELRLTIRNTGADGFAFTTALHTYLAMHDVRRAVVRGLAGVRYRDKVAGIDDALESASELAITGPVDRVYHAAPPRIVVREPGRSLSIHATGFPDTVVWNPGRDAAAALDDLGPGDDARMLCVEAAAARVPIELAPGAAWTGAQRLAAE